MAIRFTFDGETYDCDTPKEVAVLRKLLGRSVKRARRQRATTTAESTGPRPVQQPLGSFRDGGVRPSAYTMSVLRALLEGPTSGLESAALADKLGLGAKSLPPIMGHLNTLLESHGYVPKIVIERRMTYEKGRAKSLYILTEAGREIVPYLLHPAA